MSATPSTMVELGTKLPVFRLPDLDGTIVSSSRFAASPALLVAFICNHCPYVRHIRDELARFAREYQPRGLAIVAVSSNDVAAYPDDGPDGMRRESTEAGYSFPYLFDADQEVAKAFRAACTPDFFLFDKSGGLAYRGQFDGSRPGAPIPVTGSDLRAAADALLAGRAAPSPQKASIGCNIKWKRGNEPDYVRRSP